MVRDATLLTTYIRTITYVHIKYEHEDIRYVMQTITQSVIYQCNSVNEYHHDINEYRHEINEYRY